MLIFTICSLVLPLCIIIISTVNMYIFFYRNGHVILFRIPLTRYFKICNQNNEYPIWGLLYIINILSIGINFFLGGLQLIQDNKIATWFLIFMILFELFIMSLFVRKVYYC